MKDAGSVRVPVEKSGEYGASFCSNAGALRAKVVSRYIVSLNLEIVKVLY